MKIKVKLYIAGQTFTEEVRAADYNEAKQVALARNPNATVVSVTRAFECQEKLTTRHSIQLSFQVYLTQM